MWEPHPPAIAFDSKNAYVTNQGSGTVSVVNLSTNKVTTIANVGTAPTGISVTGQGSDKQLIHQRISTYGYDINGNAILSMKANGAEKVTLDNSEGGKTILTNSLGQKTLTHAHPLSPQTTPKNRRSRLSFK
jgi:YVTN family beta-propeller protein